MTAVYAGQWSGGGTSGTTNRSASGTPAIGELLVALVSVSTNTNAAPTCSDDQGGTYYLAGTATWATSANTMAIFVRTKPVEAAVAHSVTAATGSNDAGVVGVIRVSGMSRFGQAAVRQFNKADNGASSGTPAFTFGVSCVTTNVTIVAVGSGDTTTTPPGSWTERIEANQATPTTALEVATRDSGFTGTTVTWGATQSTTWAACGIELDCSVPTYLGAYPANASAMATAFGGGTWTNGYKCNETSGNLSPAFGSGNLTATGLTYSNTGMLTGETAVSMSGGTSDGAVGGDILDATTGDVVCIAVVKFNSHANTGPVVVRGGVGAEWGIRDEITAGSVRGRIVYGGGGTTESTEITYSTTGEWCVVAFCLDRGASALRIAMFSPSLGYLGVAATASSVGANSLRGSSDFDFALGGSSTLGYNAADVDIDYVAVGVGASAASSVSANLMSRLHSFMVSLEAAAASSTSNNLLLMGVG